MSTATPFPARARRRRLTLVALVAVLVSLAAPGAPAGATDPWNTNFYVEDTTSQGVAPRISVVGDSLIYNIGNHLTPKRPAQPFADNLRAVTGRKVHTWAVGGASWVNFGWPGEQPGGWPLMWNMADADNSRLTIAALATNDARIMTSDPEDYDQQKQYDMMSYTVGQTLAHSRCVMLVTTRERSVSGFSATMADQVNDNMVWLAAVSAPGRVFVADWDAHAASNNPSNSWYKTNDVHHTLTGMVEYSAFISASAQSLITNSSC